MASSSCTLKASGWRGFSIQNQTEGYKDGGNTIYTRCLCRPGRSWSFRLQHGEGNANFGGILLLGAARRGVSVSATPKSGIQKRPPVTSSESGASRGNVVNGKNTPETRSKEIEDQDPGEEEIDQGEQIEEDEEEGESIKDATEDNGGAKVVTLESMMQINDQEEAESNADATEEDGGAKVVTLESAMRMNDQEEGESNADATEEDGGAKTVTLESMMQMIKDAEKNILLLNKVRVRALEDLEQAKSRAELSGEEVKLLEARLKESEAKLKLLAQTQNKNQLLQEQVETLTAKMGEKDLEVAKVKELETELEKAQEEAKRVEGARDALQLRLDELEREVEARSKELEEMGRVAEEKTDLERKLKELEERLQEAGKKIEAGVQLEQEKTKLEGNVDGLRKELDSLRTELEEAEKKSETLASELANLESVSEKVEDAEKRLSGEQERAQALQEQIGKLQHMLMSSATERDRASIAEIARLQMKLNALLAESANAERGLKRRERERAELERRWQESERRVQALKDEAGRVGELQGRLSEMQIALAEAHRRVEEVQSEAARLQKETEGLRTETEGSRTETESLRTGTEVLRTELERLRTEKERLRTEKEGLERKLSESNARSNAQSADVKTVTEDTAALEEEIGDLEALLAEAGEATTAARRDVSERNEALEKAQSDLKLVFEQVRLLEASVSELEAEREIWVQSEQEKGILQQTVALLKEQLLQSDVDMQAQVELYTSEVESFQQDIERLQLEGAGQGVSLKPVPVGEMPWEFWSNLLLRLDALSLDKHLALDDALELRLMAWNRDPRIRDAFEKLEKVDDVRMAAGLLKLIEGKTRPGMHIVHVAAEMAPVAKVGGLADVVTGLGRALQKKGHLVEFVLPKYDCMDYSRVQDLKVLKMDFESFFDGQMHKNKLWRGIVEGLPVYFIEPHHPGRFFWRNAFYGESDDFQRFTYFCRAALEFIHKAGKKPDVIHCHDWQTALVAPLFWDVYAPKGMDTTQVAFTCHNFEYQGTDAPAALGAAGLDWREYYRPDRMQDNFMMDRINLLKGGIVFSNVVTTVSPTYSREVLGPEGGRGLHPTLLQHSSKFSGVLNGIDKEAWDPATDPLLEYQYTADDLASKYANKYALREKLGLAFENDDEGRPLVGCVTRLVPQKGVHLIRHAIYRTLEMGGQFILLGNSPVASIQRDFEGIARHFDRSPHVRLILKYDEALSHMIYSASDMFVIPSMFEPCGLTQLIAMRYGAIPIARKTGGLNDSVFDVDDKTVPDRKKNGFCFTATDEQGLNYALDRALDYYWEQPDFWQRLVQKAMRMDWGWDGPSEEYLSLYRKAVIAGKK